MIKNVNLMQNPNDIVWDKYSEDYIIQALANLGQRIGIKGDGIAYKSFTFNDILTANMSYDPNTYIGYIEYIKNNDNIIDDIESSKYKANFGIAKKKNLDDIINIDTTLSINDILYFPSELSFTIPINNIEKYSKNSICINKDNELTYMLAGKLIGYEDNDENNTVLIYEKYDTLNNKLKYSAKLFHYENNYPGDYYCLIKTKNNSYEGNSDDSLSNKYTMTIYLFDVEFFESINIKNSFKNAFKFTSYNNIDQLPFNLLDANFINIESLESYNDSENFYFDSNSPVSIIINNTQSINTFIPQQLSLILDSENNKLMSLDSNYSESVLSLYKNEYEINLDEELFMLNNDMNILYYNIFNYYNEKFYIEDRSSFIKRILVKIYEKISDYNYINSNRLYIPLDYSFHYICNNNNLMQIYYSNNIYVTLTSLKTVYLEEFWNNNNNIIYDYEGINKVKAFNFEINYNKLDNSIINSVLIKDIYTMPYINANENWSINDVDTKVKAIGADAGNPNIIIIFNKDKNNNENESFEILNAISNKEYISKSEYTQKWFNVNNALFNNIYTDNIKCCAYIPEITDINLDYFKNSIILSISDLNCLEYDEYKYNYNGSYILTMWHLTETKSGSYQFTYIKQTDTEYSLALGATVNLLNETDDETIANLNSQDLILLKSILSTVGQERLSLNNNNWLIIKNKQSEEYVQSSINSNMYNNDLNAIIQYNDTISVKANHILHEQNNKYISNLNNVSVTNILYPKYTITTSVTNGTEAIQKLKKVETNIVSTKVRESRININGQNITNIESLLEEFNSGSIIVDELKNVKIEEAKKINSNYNEYLFNENIPTIDFKEVFNRNVNVLNRVNIVSLDNNGKAYNAYIGTSYNEANKETLHIGSTPTNINIGSDTLVNEVDKSNFNIHKSLSLDFNNIILNAKNNLKSTKNILSEYINNSITYNTLNIDLIGLCMETEIPQVLTNIADWNNNSNEIFAKNNSNDNTYCIYINNVMKNYFNINIEDYKTTIHITNENSNLIKFSRSAKHDIVYLYKIPSNIIYYDNLPNNVIYIPSQLKVMYYNIVEVINGENVNSLHIYLSFNK